MKKQNVGLCPECRSEGAVVVYPDGKFTVRCVNPDCSHPIRMGSFGNRKVAVGVWANKVKFYSFE